jgi:hypothetical protein
MNLVFIKNLKTFTQYFLWELINYHLYIIKLVEVISIAFVNK